MYGVTTPHRTTKPSSSLLATLSPARRASSFRSAPQSAPSPPPRAPSTTPQLVIPLGISPPPRPPLAPQTFPPRSPSLCTPSPFLSPSQSPPLISRIDALLEEEKTRDDVVWVVFAFLACSSCPAAFAVAVVGAVAVAVAALARAWDPGAELAAELGVGGRWTTLPHAPLR